MTQGVLSSLRRCGVCGDACGRVFFSPRVFVCVFILPSEKVDGNLRPQLMYVYREVVRFVSQLSNGK